MIYIQVNLAMAFVFSPFSLASALWHLHAYDIYQFPCQFNKADFALPSSPLQSPRTPSMMCRFVCLYLGRADPSFKTYTGQRICVERLNGKKLRDRQKEGESEVWKRCCSVTAETKQGYQGDKLSLQVFSLLEMESEKGCVCSFG